MVPRYSVITYFTEQDVPSGQEAIDTCVPEWISALESDQVEVLVFPKAPEGYNWQALNQAVKAAIGQYICVFPPDIEIATPHWLELFLAYLETSQVQILGLWGFTGIQTGRTEAVGLSWSVEGSVCHQAGLMRSEIEMPGNQVQEVVALGRSLLFSRRETLLGSPFEMSDDSAIDHLITRYSFRVGVEQGETLGVLTGIDYQLAHEQISDACVTIAGDERYGHFCPMNAPDLKLWQLNLDAFIRHDPEFIQSLFFFLPYGGGYQFSFKEEGRIIATGGKRDALVLDNAVDVTGLEQQQTFVVLGAGAGHLIDQILKATSAELVIVEPETRLLVELFKHYDWGIYIAQKRLKFISVPRGHHLVEQLSLQWVTRMMQSLLLRNRLPTQVIRGYSHHLNSRFFTLIERALELSLQQRSQIMQWRRQTHTSFDVTVVSPKCAIFNDLAYCFDHLGLKTRLFTVNDVPASLSRQEYEQLLMQLTVDSSRLTVYRNRSLLETESLELGAGNEAYMPGKHLSWWWDVPNVASFIDGYDSGTRRPALGFAHELLPLLPPGSNWLPPGARTDFCVAPICKANPSMAISFVGQSRCDLLKSNLAILEQILESYCSNDVSAAFSCLSASGSYRLLHQRLLELEDDIVSCISLLSEIMPPQGYYLNYIFQMAKTAAFRLAVIETLFREGLPVQVFGDQGWVDNQIVPEKFYRGVAQPDQLVSIYQGSRVNLNLNFMQVSSTINPKVLDIAACGGTVLTDYRPELELLFPDPGLRPQQFKTLEDLVPQLELAMECNQAQLLEQAHYIRSRHSLQARASWIAEQFLTD